MILPTEGTPEKIINQQSNTSSWYKYTQEQDIKFSNNVYFFHLVAYQQGFLFASHLVCVKYQGYFHSPKHELMRKSSCLALLSSAVASNRPTEALASVISFTFVVYSHYKHS